MIIEDEAIVLEIKKVLEKSVLIKCFSHNHGLISGFYNDRQSKILNHGQSKMNYKRFLQNNISTVGNCVKVKLHVQNASKSSVFQYIEIMNNNHMSLLLDMNKSMLLYTVFSLLSSTLREFDPYIHLWERVQKLIRHLMITDNKLHLIKEYIVWEIDLLKHIGFGLNLTQCVVTGSREDLRYISPKSGQAVSGVAGEKYKDRLFYLPKFLTQKDTIPASKGDISSALNIMEYFLKKYALQQIPQCRERLHFFIAM
jgi:DNA repair protein RecO (recombination protein O)